MKNSSSRFESTGYALVLGVVVLGGAALQGWQGGWHWLPLVWLVPALLCIAAWVRRSQSDQCYLRDIQAMAQDVAHGKFARRISHIPASGTFHDLCWDMNDMLGFQKNLLL